jgi:predicted phage-related endonuclease
MWTNEELNQYVIDSDFSLGSGDIAKVCLMSRWGDPHTVFGRYHRDYSVETNEHILRGESFEDPIGFKLYPAAKFGTDVIKGEPTNHSVLTWARATPDFVHEDGSINVEVKCPSGLAFENYRNNSEYYAQCQWQMFVCGIPKTHFCVFNGTTGVLELMHEWDADKDVQLHLIKTAYNFMRNHLVPGIEPPITGSKGCADAILHKFPRSEREELLNADTDQERWVEAYLEAKQSVVDAQVKLDLAANHIKDFIGDSVGMMTDYGKVMWKSSNRNTVDWKSVAREADIDDGLIAKHTRSHAYRTFRPFLKGGI